MTQTNPPLKVKIRLENKTLVNALDLVLLLQDARVLEHASEQQTFFIHAPKGTTNYRLWAENVFNRARQLDVPALIIRCGAESESCAENGNTNTAQLVCPDCGAECRHPVHLYNHWMKYHAANSLPQMQQTNEQIRIKEVE